MLGADKGRRGPGSRGPDSAQVLRVAVPCPRREPGPKAGSHQPFPTDLQPGALSPEHVTPRGSGSWPPLSLGLAVPLGLPQGGTKGCSH